MRVHNLRIKFNFWLNQLNTTPIQQQAVSEQTAGLEHENKFDLFSPQSLDLTISLVLKPTAAHAFIPHVPLLRLVLSDCSFGSEAGWSICIFSHYSPAHWLTDWLMEGPLLSHSVVAVLDRKLWTDTYYNTIPQTFFSKNLTLVWLNKCTSICSQVKSPTAPFLTRLM